MSIEVGKIYHSLPSNRLKALKQRESIGGKSSKFTIKTEKAQSNSLPSNGRKKKIANIVHGKDTKNTGRNTKATDETEKKRIDLLGHENGKRGVYGSHYMVGRGKVVRKRKICYSAEDEKLKGSPVIAKTFDGGESKNATLYRQRENSISEL